ncbi:MAG: cyclic nucleotide-binding domain-containing protein [Gammaproteobacteria bacterium]|jgi:CRP-like cAMP-binding protein|nr:cyclic nucleotide-binding domain-containing protein [Gammaproteobacteria bacterium]
MHKHELIPRLERTAIFDDFRREDFEALIAYLTVHRVDAGTLIFREGEKGTRMCLVLEGRLEVFKDDDSGVRKKITDVGAGKLIGEMSLIDGMPYSATVVASAVSTLVMLSRDNLQRICEERPRVGNRLLWKIGNLLSLRLRQTTGRLIDRM